MAGRHRSTRVLQSHDAGVVDQHIYAPELVVHRLEKADIGLARDVALDGDRLDFPGVLPLRPRPCGS